MQIFEGEGQFSFAGQHFIMKPGQGVLLLPGVPHEYAALTPAWKTYYITFSGSLVQSILSAIGLHNSNLYQLDKPELFYELFHAFMKNVHIKPEFPASE
ncbi:AraC family ligand binding domain-containing protein [Paenibacillus sp. N3.4]|uniref:AraC family ligand binding domain-containing protein n=1 Tax=Paenibacillus sp. N3.4 TaxID=2603222 RepID=UPI0011CC776D|nr:hypothetical protein FU659_28795 [Paenibacillus sp. N3.4]